jgi:hypothetical protein
MTLGSMLISAFSYIWGSIDMMNDNIKDWKLTGKNAKAVEEAE